ncbi:MAG: RpiB/LacA/LacB family sugar-phosphate isomerase [Nanoarchaeota archaeon]
MKNKIIKVFLGADHAGFKLKEKIRPLLIKKGYLVNDLSPELNENDDYPEHAFRVSRAVRQNSGSKGILICGSGIGMSIAANRLKSIRAVDAYDAYTAKMSRSDEDSNVLCLRARKFSDKENVHLMNIWLSTPFSGKSRHVRRIRELDE